MFHVPGLKGLRLKTAYVGKQTAEIITTILTTSITMITIRILRLTIILFKRSCVLLPWPGLLGLGALSLYIYIYTHTYTDTINCLQLLLGSRIGVLLRALSLYTYTINIIQLLLASKIEVSLRAMYIQLTLSKCHWVGAVSKIAVF